MRWKHLWLLVVLLGSVGLVAAQDTAPQITAFDLGTITISVPELDSVPIETPLTGVLGLPPGDAAHPLVLILHGRHGICNLQTMAPYPCPDDSPEARFDLGYRYLVEALAERGYAALAINLNAAMTTAFGDGAVDPRALQIVEGHLRPLQQAVQEGTPTYDLPLQGRIDFSQLALIGHSSGGGAALALTRAYAGTELDIDALLLLAAAANFEGPETMDRPGADLLNYYSTPSDLPVVAVLPDCDGDQIQFWSQFAYEAARLDPDRRAFASSVRLLRANHNGFNTTLDTNPDNRFGYPPCFAETADIMPPADQQSWLAAFAPDFLDAALQSDIITPFDAAAESPGELYGESVQTALTIASENRMVLLHPTDYSERSQNTLGGAVRSGNLGVSICLTGDICNAPIITPGRFGYLRVGYFGRGSLTFELPAASQDISGYTHLHLRAAPDYLSRANTPGEAQTFALVLLDTTGSLAQVDLPADLPSLAVPPPSEFYGYDPFMTYPASIRVPLSAFEGVDLAQIEAVRLQFGATRQGTMMLADLEFIDTGE